MGVAIAVLTSSATLAQAGEHRISCPVTDYPFKLCRDGGACGDLGYPEDNQDVLRFLNMSAGDEVSFKASVPSKIKDDVFVTLSGHSGTVYADQNRTIAPGASAAPPFPSYKATSGGVHSFKMVLPNQDTEPAALDYTVSCTATPPPTGSARIRIIKETNGGDGTFPFTSSEPADARIPPPGSITTSNGFGSFDILVTNFPNAGGKRLDVDITEGPVDGWTVDSVTCIESGGDNNSSGQVHQGEGIAKIKLERGETVACTFTNTSSATGSITIIKRADAGGTFPFTTSSSGSTIDSAFNLEVPNGGGSVSRKFDDLSASAAGTNYTFTEGTVDGFTLKDLFCSGGTDIEYPDTTTASIPLKPGQDVECTFENAAQGASTTIPLTITKALPKPNSTGTFTFNLQQATLLDTRSISAAGSVAPFTVKRGTPLTIQEIITNTSLDYTTTATCTGADSSFDPASRTLTLTPPADTGVTKIDCTFENDKIGGGSQGQRPTLELQKTTSTPTFVRPGDILRYDYRVMNTSAFGTAVSNLIVKDDQISDVSCPKTALLASQSVVCTGSYIVTPADAAKGSVKNTAQAMASYTTNDGNATVASNEATVTVERNDTFIRERTQQVIGNFLQRRTDLLLSEEPDRNRYVRRFTGSLWGEQSSQVASSGSGSKVSLTGDGSAARFAFSTGLRQMAADARAAAEVERTGKEVDGMMALGASPSAASGAEQLLRSGWDLWVEGHYAHFDDDRLSGGNSGHLGVMYVGADYLLTPAILVGALIQFDTMEDDSAAAGTAVKGNGWLAGPYMSAKLSDNLFFDARVAWGRSDNSVDPLGFYTDDFDTDRWLAKGNLTGNWNWDAWRFTPSVGVSYVEETQKAYSNALGIYIPGQTVSLGRVTFGPEIGYRFQAEDGTYIEPHASIMGIWDFDKSDALVLGDEIAGTDEFRAKFQAGILFTMPAGYTVRATGSYDGIGANDFEAYGGQLWVNLPLN